MCGRRNLGFHHEQPLRSTHRHGYYGAQGDTLTGSFDLGDARTWPIDEDLAEGNEISLRLDRDGSPMAYGMLATIEGDSISGNAMGTEAPWTMTRRS